MVTGLDVASIIASVGPQEPDIVEVTRLPDGEIMVRYDDILVTLELEAETSASRARPETMSTTGSASGDSAVA